MQVVVVDDASDMMDALMYLGTLEKEFQAKGWQLHRIAERNVYVGRSVVITSLKDYFLTRTNIYRSRKKFCSKQG